jgi:hypothetical protein
LEILVGQVVSSEYFFVYQTAMARVGASVQLSRDPTGSPYFDDEAALRASLQALRDRTVPAAGTNAVLWTHKGRFNLAFGIWLPPGETVVFRPDSGDEPSLVAQLPFDQFVALG